MPFHLRLTIPLKFLHLTSWHMHFSEVFLSFRVWMGLASQGNTEHAWMDEWTGFAIKMSGGWMMDEGEWQGWVWREIKMRVFVTEIWPESENSVAQIHLEHKEVMKRGWRKECKEGQKERCRSNKRTRRALYFISMLHSNNAEHIKALVGLPAGSRS